MNTIAYMFPGQGSQAIGMGALLFNKFPDLTAEADRILGYSIRDLCLESGGARLSQTAHTQPALYVVEALTYLDMVRDSGRKPDYVIGHSLGEYVALFAAEAFDFATGLRLVKRRGELMARAVGGSMAAVLGLDGARVRSVLQEERLHTLDVANLNSPTQVVLSGLKDDVIRAQPLFEAAGARYIPLNVSGAFHSRHMRPARAEFELFLQSVQLAEPRLPVVSNVEALPYTREKAKRLLAEQITEPVDWVGGVRYLLDEGVQEFHEAGPGQVLTKLVQQTRRARQAATPDQADRARVASGRAMFTARDVR